MAGEGGGGHAPTGLPASLRVILVDDDLASLVVLKKMLEDCRYSVIACQSGEEALETLRNNKDGFDIIMSDVRMPGIDGLQLLAEIVTMRIDSPVILFSDEPEDDMISSGICGGACDFLAKPIHISTLKMIWKHLIHKMESAGKETEAPNTLISSSVLHSDEQISPGIEQPDYNAMKRKRSSDSTDGGNSTDSGGSLKENDEGQSNVTEALTTKKKLRMSWKPEAHNAFLEAIKSLHPQKPLPKKIQEYMETKHGITGLTRQIISSHLQKHRENMKKLNNRIPGDPRISSQATIYGVRAPDPLPSTSQNLSSISWGASSRHQAPTTQAYWQPMYQMEPHPNHFRMFLGNSFPQTASGGHDAFLSSQPPAHQIPRNPSVGPMILGQSFPGVSSIGSTIQTTTPANIYSTGMESQKLPLGSSGGVYNSNESCRSSVLAQGDFVDRDVPSMTLEQDVADNWLKELSFEALFQDSAFW